MDSLPRALREKLLRRRQERPEIASRSKTVSGEDDRMPMPRPPPFPRPSCSSCPAPCRELSSYPPSVASTIDWTSPLAGTVKPYQRHIVIATGKADWPSEITDEDGALAQTLTRHLPAAATRTTIISNSSTPPPDLALPDVTDLFVLPDWKVVRAVASADAQLVVSAFFAGSASTPDRALNGSTPDRAPGGSTPDRASIGGSRALATEEVRACKAEYGRTLRIDDLAVDSLVLICSHRRRDRRCGLTAPLLKHAFELELRQADLYRSYDDTRPGGTMIALVSHIGGHKLAGNVVVYRKSDGDVQGIWFGRVDPQHVSHIVQDTILNGTVHGELLRGGIWVKHGTNVNAW